MAAADLWFPAYVGLGSNLDDPAEQIRRAFIELAELPATRLMARSRLYQNPPFGDVPQPDYVNAAAALLTRLTSTEFLAHLKDIERRHGRQRTDGSRWGPRQLDLDLLCYSSEIRNDQGLTLPHPGIRDRNFVLLPLSEVAPGLEIHGLGVVAALALRAGTKGLTALT